MSELVKMFVNGQAMRGGPLSDALDRADYLGQVETAPAYRFYSVRDEFPGLLPVEHSGRAVPGEIYQLPYEMLRTQLLPREPTELELTVIELADGSGSLSMRMRADAVHLPGVSDISDAGGWLAYRASRTSGG
jgi:gamma-glutamylcyclotransferase (GGCT)/AIG2-like uncharacterized protein YtfP